jgi:hypothetical protein
MTTESGSHSAVLAPQVVFFQSPIFWLTAVSLLCLCPFLGKAVHVDDPLFLWAAQHIQHHPLDFYGFPVNWYDVEMPMWRVMQNPPLASYYLAGVGSLFGWTEPVLHLAFLLPAVGVVLGTYYLARPLCGRPGLAALATLFAPVFLVSSTNLMCDTLLLCFWVWALAFWERGIRQQSQGLLLLAGVAAALAGLTKYFGFALVPLMLAHALVHCVLPWQGRSSQGSPESPIGASGKKVYVPTGLTQIRLLPPSCVPRRLGLLARVCLALAIPVGAFWGYGKWTQAVYGEDLFRSAAYYTEEFRSKYPDTLPERVLVGLGFVGASTFSVASFLPWLWSPRQFAFGLAAPVLVVVGLLGVVQLGRNNLYEGEHLRWSLVIQVVLWASLGILLVALAGADLERRRDALSVLFVLWVGGTFVFASMVNWTTNARSIMPVVPALAILAMRQLDARWGVPPPERCWREAWPLIPVGVLSVLLCCADTWAANGMRATAESVADKYEVSTEQGTLWFRGHWGFQYYLQQRGGKPYDWRRQQREDVIVVPEDNYSLTWVHFSEGKVLEVIEWPGFPWLATMNKAAGAGFYSESWGPLPFALGPTRLHRYRVIAITATPEQE